MKRIVKIILCTAAMLICGNVYAEASAVFDNLTDGGQYYTYLMSEVSVSGSGEHAEIYIDGALTDSADGLPAVFDLSGISSGVRKIKAVVYDSANNQSSSEITVNAVEAAKKQEYSYDFEDLDEEILSAGSKSFYPNISGNAESGYFGIKSIDSAYGKSIVVGMEEPNAGKTASAWIGFSGKNAAKSIMEADIYIDKCADFSLYLRGSTGSITSTDITFKKDGYIYFSGNQGNGADKLKYEEKTWYSIEYIIDAENHTYSFIIDGKLAALNYKMKNQNFDVINTIRVTAPKTNEIKSFMAVDNPVIITCADMPYILQAGADGGADYNDEYVDVTFTGNIGTSGLSAENITLNGANAAEGFEVKDNKTLRLLLKNRLISNSEYSLKINGGITSNVSGQTQEASVPMELIFKTKPAPIEYNSYSLDGLNFTCELKNYTSEDTTVYLIECVYSGNRLTAINHLPINVPADGVYTLTYTAAGEGSRLAVLNGTENASAVSEKLFIME